MFVVNEQVYEFVKSIPKGKVATYGQIAFYMGNKNCVDLKISQMNL